MFGFEFMPAPFVLSRLQVRLTMQALDAPMSHNSNERVGVYFTNALTGLENVQGNTEEEGQQPPKPNQLSLFMPELQEDYDRANRVKEHPDVLVVIGNPPYNGFVGMALGEERSQAGLQRNPTGEEAQSAGP